jgi:hypothetical protein
LLVCGPGLPALGGCADVVVGEDLDDLPALALGTTRAVLTLALDAEAFALAVV